MTYVGLLVGANKGDLLNPAALGTFFASDRPTRRSAKVLDTSVIIDGRIADVCDTRLIDTVLIVPRFVLQELQAIADSSDQLSKSNVWYCSSTAFAAPRYSRMMARRTLVTCTGWYRRFRTRTLVESNHTSVCGS